MHPPNNYSDIIYKVNESLFNHDVGLLITVLGLDSSLGSPLIPVDHIEKLELKDAIEYVRSSKDKDTLFQIHDIFGEYLGEKITFFNNLIDNSIYISNYEYDDQYLLVERCYLELFGIWSPRLIQIHNSQNIGEELLYEEYDQRRYVLCPMKEEEIDMIHCKKCPCSKIKEDKYHKIRKYYCKYKESLDESRCKEDYY